MKKFNRIYVLGVVVSLLPILLTISLYNRLPDMIPSHFDFNGNIDGYGSKNLIGFGMPIFMAVMIIFMAFMMESDPKKHRYSQKLKNIMVLFISLMSVVLVTSTLLIGIGYNIKMDILVPIFIGVLFVIIGNYLPKCRQNYTMGFKLPWTLNSQENWDKTHRLAGKCFVISGLIFLISAFISSFKLEIFIAVMIISTGIPTVYSYMLYKKGV